MFDLVTLISRDYARINSVNENEEEADDDQKTAVRQWLLGVAGVGGRDPGTGEGFERRVLRPAGKAMHDVLCILVRADLLCGQYFCCVCIMFV